MKKLTVGILVSYYMAMFVMPTVALAQDAFVDAEVTGVPGVSLELELCAGEYQPDVLVKFNGKSYGEIDPKLPHGNYYLPIGTSGSANIKIQPTTACPKVSDIRFKLNGKLYTDASAKAASVIDDSTPAPVGGDSLPSGDSLPNMDDLPNIDSVAKVLKVIDNITNWMFTIFIAVAVIFVLLAAFTYLTSGGGEETAKAHKMILYSAVAIAVAILAKGVVNVVKSIVR